MGVERNRAKSWGEVATSMGGSQQSGGGNHVQLASLNAVDEQAGSTRSSAQASTSHNSLVVLHVDEPVTQVVSSKKSRIGCEQL